MNKIIDLNKKEISFVTGGLTAKKIAAASWKDWVTEHAVGIAVGLVVMVGSIVLLKFCCWAVPISKDLNEGHD
jgi:hypothetical protein